MRIAVMTGGGDCPGLNAVIQAVVTRATRYGYQILGVQNGYAGLMNGDIKPLSLESVEGIFRLGGTILGTSRTNPFKEEGGSRKVIKTVEEFNLNALIIIGGDDTLGAAQRINEKLGIPTVGVPKTIDNDLSSTDNCVGFWTAVNTAADAIDRLHTTAKSHRRVIIVEVMGRYAGWLTLFAGLASGAHFILLPEEPFEIKDVCEVIMDREANGWEYSIIAVAEGAKPKEVEDLVTISKERDEYGHIRLGGIAKTLEKEIAKRTGKTTRSVVLGHTQRGGKPDSFDIILGIRLGASAVDLVKKKKFGYAVSQRGPDVVPVKLEKMVSELRTVKKDLLELANFYSIV